MNERLALGTVQFGLRYGVSNRQGKTSDDEAAAILASARQHGMSTLDTAIAYGQSEELLGRLGVSDWKVTTKLPPIPDDGIDVERWVHDSLAGSLSRLGVDRLEAVLLHRSRDLQSTHGRSLYRALCDAKAKGLTSKIGISIYDPGELDDLLAHCPVDIVQAPFNVVDRRLVESGWLTRLHDSGIEVHVRSVFLQGLLLMRSDERPDYFRVWNNLWRQWDRWLAERDATALQVCIAFGLSDPRVARVVVGVESLAQLNEIIAAAKVTAASPPDSLRSNDPDLVNPSKWKLH